MPSPAVRRVTTTARLAILPVLLFIALAVWAVSSPVGSSPDEDWHLSSIWCGQGIQQGVCESSPIAGERKVPVALPHAAECYAHHPKVGAACQSAWFAPEKRNLASTSRGDFNGAYPPAFYFTMHFFVGTDISRSVMTMRLVNAALFDGLLTSTYWLLPRRRRLMAATATTVTVVPLGVFLVPSINASSWAITSAAVLFPALVGFFETTGRRRIALAAVSLVATVMGAGARADAAVYSVIAAVLATVVAAPRDRRVWRLAPVPLLVVAVSALFYLTSGQSTFASTGLAGGTVRTGLASQVAYDLLNVPSLWAGAFGYESWGLGWLDTPMPAVVCVVNLAAFGGLVFTGIRQLSRRKGLALVAALAAVWLIPTLILVQSKEVVGGLVQPRYVLPLLVLFAEVALLRVGSSSRQVGRAPLLTAAAALGATNLVALYTNFRRYLTGLGAARLDLDARPEWWWPVPVPPVAMLLIGGAAFAAALVLCSLAVLRDDEAAATAAGSVAPSRIPADAGSRLQRAAA